MNRVSIAIGAFAALSFACAGFLYSRKRFNAELKKKKALEQDLQDILNILPLSDIKCVIEKYARHDKQIARTITFINDQGQFILKELRKIPEIHLFTFILLELGLNVDHWIQELKVFYQALPKFDHEKPEEADGGLTGMVCRIMSLISQENMSALLHEKAERSKSFRFFLLSLRSQQFLDLCQALRDNSEIQRNYFWAREDDIEVVFALEFLGDLYVYLTHNL
ncbi:hypothetical protein TKK_0009183 [Trichogramma kaykai]